VLRSAWRREGIGLLALKTAKVDGGRITISLVVLIVIICESRIITIVSKMICCNGSTENVTILLTS
jgi:hypothetical protein